MNPFSSEAIDFIYEASRGIPRVINKICDISLLAAYSRSLAQIDSRLVEEAFAEAEGITV